MYTWVDRRVARTHIYPNTHINTHGFPLCSLNAHPWAWVLLSNIILGETAFSCQQFQLIIPLSLCLTPAVQIQRAAWDSSPVSGICLHPSNLSSFVVQHFLSVKRRAAAICFCAVYLCLCPISICHFYYIFLCVHSSLEDALFLAFAFRKKKKKKEKK